MSDHGAIRPPTTGADDRNLHAAVRVVFANSTARLAASYTTDDIWCLFADADTNNIYILTGISPATFVAIGVGDGLTAVVDDTTPQYGGNMDQNGSYLTDDSGADVVLNAAAGQDVDLQVNSTSVLLVDGELITVAKKVTGGAGIDLDLNAVSGQVVDLMVNDTSVLTLSAALATFAQEVLFSESAGFTLQTDTGTGAKTINWGSGNKMKFTCGAGDVTFSFTDATSPASFTLIFVQDATGGRSITWPAGILWVGGLEPTIDTSANGVSIISFLWDGTSYYGSGAPTWATA